MSIVVMVPTYISMCEVSTFAQVLQRRFVMIARFDEKLFTTK